jgi:hypothetical protein
MKIKMDLSGLKRLQRNAKAFHGTHQVKLVDILTPAFMRSNTRFSSLEDLIRQAGVAEESFAEMSDADKDAMVRTNTKFHSWQELLNAGTVEYTKKQLFK